MSHEAFLSQDEIDALMAGMSGDADAPAATPQRDDSHVQPYDLGSPERVVHRRMQTLELINERFARHLHGVLLAFMRRSADITTDAIRIQKYADFERNLPVPSNLNMVQLKPLRGTALFAFDPNLIFLIIDNLFGSDGRYHMRVEGRDFTATEQRIIQRLLNLTLSSYSRAWQPVCALETEYLRSEMHTRFASITSANEAVVVTTFHIEFGSGGGDLNICLPYAMIEPLREQLIRPLQPARLAELDQRWMQQLSRQMHHAELELVAELGRVETRVGTLARLRVGDVLPLQIPEQITACVDGMPVMHCSYGTHNGHYALRVQGLLDPRGDNAATGQADTPVNASTTPDTPAIPSDSVSSQTSAS